MPLVHRVARVGTIALTLLVGTGEAAMANPPVEAFGELPQYSDWRLAPDAKHIAVIQPINGVPTAIIYTVGAPPGAKVIEYLGRAGNIVSGLQWLSSDRLLVDFTQNGHALNDVVARHWAAASCIDVDGSHETNLSPGPYAVDLGDRNHAYLTLISGGGDGGAVTGALLSNGGYQGDLYEVNFRTGGLSLATHGARNTVDFVLDEHGQAVARIDIDKDELKERVFTRSGSEWKNIATFDDSQRGLVEASVEGVLYDRPSLAVLRYRKAATDQLDRIDLNGQQVETLFNDPTYDINRILRDEWTGKVVGVSYIADGPADIYLDPSLQSLQRGLEQAFKPNFVNVASKSQAGDKAIIAVEGPRQPPTYLFYDRTTKQASVIANAYPKLVPGDLGEVRPITYTARDGLTIHAFLTYPPGETSKSGLPTVVLPHGGPEARDEVGFDWLAQFLANRGYLVFQPNFRGSTGYGYVFHDAGDGQWGTGMINDITDGVKKLVQDGTADQKRICIVGASYGGYAALAGATFTPDLYACAASYAGIGDVSELYAFARRGSGNSKFEMAAMERMIGAKFGDTARLDAISPAKHADRIRVPVLLVHSERDVTVPIDQSNEEYKTLTDAGKSVQIVRLAGDDHYLSLSASRIEFLKALEAFLAKNLGH
jgi:dipeptidyl aminopeptidase/acylaminoacyl peptidase